MLQLLDLPVAAAPPPAPAVLPVSVAPAVPVQLTPQQVALMQRNKERALLLKQIATLQNQLQTAYP